MNRILTFALLLLATACWANRAIQGSRPSDSSNSSHQATAAADQKTLTGPGGLPLRGFEFDTVTTDSKGAVTARRKGRSQAQWSGSPTAQGKPPYGVS
jgi:hypothetical protein